MRDFAFRLLEKDKPTKAVSWKPLPWKRNSGTTVVQPNDADRFPRFTQPLQSHVHSWDGVGIATTIIQKEKRERRRRWIHREISGLSVLKTDKWKQVTLKKTFEKNVWKSNCQTQRFNQQKIKSFCSSSKTRPGRGARVWCSFQNPYMHYFKSMWKRVCYKQDKT